MRDELSEQQIRSYRDQGFLVIEGFFNPGELEVFRAAAEEAVQKRLAALANGMREGSVHRTVPQRLKRIIGVQAGNRIRTRLRSIFGSRRVPIGFNGVLDTNQADRESYYAQVYVQCIHLAAEHEGLHRVVTDPRIGQIAGLLSGADGIRLYHDQALYKPPFGNPTAWHLDNPYWAFSSRQAMTMWVALDDATVSNGCMWYIPASHATASMDKNIPIGDNFAGLFKLYPQWRHVDPVACPCAAGSVVFHNGLVAHGAGVNMTNKPRRAFACAFMPDGATFNGNKDVLPAEYFKRLRVGATLSDDRYHPLIWHKYRDQSPAPATPVKAVAVTAA